MLTILDILPLELLGRVLLVAIQTDSDGTACVLDNIVRLRKVCRQFNRVILDMQSSTPILRMAFALYWGLRQHTRVTFDDVDLRMDCKCTPRGIRVFIASDWYNVWCLVQRPDNTRYRCWLPDGHDTDVITVHDFGDDVCVVICNLDIVHLSPTSVTGTVICSGTNIRSSYAYNRGFIVTRVRVDGPTSTLLIYMVSPEYPAGIPLPVLTDHHVLLYDGVIRTVFNDAFYTYDGVELKQCIDNLNMLYPGYVYMMTRGSMVLHLGTYGYKYTMPTHDGLFAIKGEHCLIENRGPLVIVTDATNVRLYYDHIMLYTTKHAMSVGVTDGTIVIQCSDHMKIVPFDAEVNNPSDTFVGPGGANPS